MTRNGLTAGLSATMFAVMTGLACSTPTGGSEAIVDASTQRTTREIVEVRGRGGMQPARVVIRDASTWETFWGNMVANQTPRPPTPVVDFRRSIVLYAAMGQRNSGGYAISIDSVLVDQGSLRAIVRSVSPGRGCVTVQVINAPAVAVAVDRVDGQVTFIERAETKDCG